MKRERARTSYTEFLLLISSELVCALRDGVQDDGRDDCETLLVCRGSVTDFAPTRIQVVF